MANFLPRKTRGNEKRLTEKDLYGWLVQPDLSLGPVQFQLLSPQPSNGTDNGVDAFLEATWQGRTTKFVCQLKTLSTPKTIEAAVAQAKRLSDILNLHPLVLVPYLSEERLIELERQGVSGLDLNGNGVLTVPNFYVWRSGEANKFPEPTTLKNIYAGDSSIFARCFLLQPNFNTLAELQVFAERHTLLKPSQEGNTLRLSTSSKVVQVLAEELIVHKTKDGLRLLDRRRLIAKLKSGYKLSSGPNVIGRTPLDEHELWKRLQELRSEEGIRSVATGLSSASHYKVLSGIDRLSLYVDDLEVVRRALDIKEGRAFANIEIVEAEKNLPFFDVRREGDVTWSSPIQAWLELAQSGPREQEAAQSLEEVFRLGKGLVL
jgi:hypothetical protein